jgi:hypothetical protein
MFGIDLKTLNYEEVRSYNALIEGYKSQQIEVADIRKEITKIKNELALELCQTSVEEKEKIIRLQARLHNMIMLEQFTLKPEIAEVELKKHLEKLSNNLEKGTTL